MTHSTHKKLAFKEFTVFVSLLFVGFVLMPIVIYWIGQNIFGNYGGNGYGDFFGTLSAKIRNGEIVAWLFVLSPYLAWQSFRLTRLAWHKAGGPKFEKT